MHAEPFGIKPNQWQWTWLISTSNKRTFRFYKHVEFRFPVCLDSVYKQWQIISVYAYTISPVLACNVSWVGLMTRVDYVTYMRCQWPDTKEAQGAEQRPASGPTLRRPKVQSNGHAVSRWAACLSDFSSVSRLSTTWRVPITGVRWWC